MMGRETFPFKPREGRDRRDWRERHDSKFQNFELRTSNLEPLPVSPIPPVPRGLTQPARGFGRRWGSEGIVGPGVFGIAATEFFFHFEIGRLPEA